MKLNPDFIMQNVGTETIMVPVNESAQRYRGVIRLNETAAFIAKKLINGNTILGLKKALAEEYEGTEEQFERSVRETIAALTEAGAIIDNDDDKVKNIH